MPKATLNKKLVCVLLPKMAIRVFCKKLEKLLCLFSGQEV
jgi:hypothetical protein